MHLDLVCRHHTCTAKTIAFLVFGHILIQIDVGFRFNCCNLRLYSIWFWCCLISKALDWFDDIDEFIAETRIKKVGVANCYIAIKCE
jgi:hypothetical protein